MDSSLIDQIISSKGPLSGQKLQRIQPISGGCIHDAWKLELTTGETFFAKTNSSEFYEILKFECTGLSNLNIYSDNSLLLIPEPLCLQQLESGAILLMPWIEMAGIDERNLGKGLAMIHKVSATQSLGLFGWETDGFIGSGPQVGGFKNNWGECFIKLRLMPQLEIAAKWGLNLYRYSKLLSQLTHFLNEHNPSPSIVHGDLWKGNAGITSNGLGVLFDPAIWWADREVDLAMTKLFGGFSQNFYQAYYEIWPLEGSEEERINIYNLYHLLNHANLFGGSYKSQCLSNLNRLEALFVN